MMTNVNSDENQEFSLFKDQFPDMLLHDFRSPIGAIISALDIVQHVIENDPLDTPDSVETIEACTDVAVCNAHHLLRLVDTLSEMALLRGEQQPVNRDAIPLEFLIKQRIHAVSTSYQKDAVELRYEIAPSLATALVDIDLGLIERVLNNLLDNARRFTPSGGEVRVIVSPSNREHSVNVQVVDTGSGIPENMREQIFLEFQQVEDQKPVNGKRGNGLGLAFCKLALEAHGQRIWVEPNQPQGSRFIFTLPRAN